MDNYYSTSYKTICRVLIFLFLFNPAVVIAANVTEVRVDDTKTAVGRANNGVTIVNIAKASKGGVSHNRFLQFDVGQRGVVINNSAAITNTQLAGQIFGNDLLEGNSANLIINEVTGGSRSQLQGFTEIAGQQAGYIFANANGITCNGCGFINTPTITLTTGALSFFDGNLSKIAVASGDVSFEGDGLNALNSDRVNVFARAVNINAAIYANEFNVLSGTNDIAPDLSTFTTNESVDQTHIPQFAIDSSSLGGMYANAITLVGTEKGVGVNLEGEMAASNVTLDANGQLTVSGNITSENDIDIKTNSLVNSGRIIVGIDANNEVNNSGIISINSEEVTNIGFIGSTRSTSIETTRLDNRNGELSSNGDLTISSEEVDNSNGKITANQMVNVSGTKLNNENGTLSSGQKMDLAIADKLTNDNGVISANELTIKSAAVSNDEGSIVSNSLKASIDEELTNTKGTILANDGSLTIESTEINNKEGTIAASDALLIETGTLSNERGNIQSQKSTSLNVDNIDNTSGTISALETVKLDVKSEINNLQGKIIADGASDIITEDINNESGVIQAGEELSVSVNEVNNTDGVISTDDALQLTASTLENLRGTIQSLSDSLDSMTRIDISDFVSNEAGTIQTNNNQFYLSAKNVDNLSIDETLANIIHTGSGDFELNVDTQLNNSGNIFSSGNFSISAQSLINESVLSLSNLSLTESLTNSGTIQSQLLNLDLSGNLNNSNGMLSQLSETQHQINAANILNASGTIESNAQSLTLVANNLDNKSGSIVSLNTAENLFQFANINNAQGSIYTQDSLALTTDNLSNRLGQLQSKNELTIDLLDLDNFEGQIAAESVLNLNVENDLINNSGSLITNENLSISATNIENKLGVISALGTTQGLSSTITATNVINNLSGQITVNNSQLLIQSDSLFNRLSTESDIEAQITHAGDAQSVLDIESLLVNKGSIASNADLFISTKALDNSGQLSLSMLTVFDSLTNDGAIGATKLLLSLTEALDNSNGLLSQTGEEEQEITATKIINTSGRIESAANALTINSDDINNVNGEVVSRGDNELTITTENLNNDNGSITSHQSIVIQSQQLNNQQGIIESLQQLSLALDLLDNTQGKVLANSELSITVNDDIINDDGVISSDNTIKLSANNLNNVNGVIQSLGNTAQSSTELNITDKLLNQNGTIASHNDTLEISTISLVNDGEASLINHSGSNQLSIHAKSVNTQGNIIANNQLAFESENVENSGVIQSAQLDLKVSDSLTNKGTISHTGTGEQTISLPVLNNEGLIVSNADTLVITTPRLSNSGTINHVGQTQLSFVVTDIDNIAGEITSAGDLTVNAQQLNNNQGVFSAIAKLNIDAITLNNTSGNLTANDSITLNIEQSLDNTQGKIVSKSANTIAANAINNTSGLISSESGEHSIIESKTNINNINGVIESGSKSLTIKAHDLTNTITNDGKASVNHTGTQKLILDIENQINNTGDIAAKNTLLVNTQQLTNSGDITASQLTVASNTIENTGLLSHTSRAVQQITAQQINNTGRIESAAGQLAINAANALTNNGELVYQGEGSVVVTSENIVNSGEVVSANGLTLTAENISNSGVIESSLAHLNSTTLNNQQGVISGLLALNLTSSIIDNDQGVISSNKDLAISSADLSNDGGVIQSTTETGQAELAIANTLNNTNGIISTQGNTTTITANELINRGQDATINLNSQVNNINVKEKLINDTTIQSEHHLSLEAHQVDNSKNIIAQQLNIIAESALNNSGTLTQTGSQAQSIESKDINNQGGRIESASDELTLKGNTFENNNGQLILTGAGQHIVNTKTFNNSNGITSIASDLTITADTINNQSGVIESASKITINNASINNNRGVIESADNISIDDAKAIINTRGAIVAENKIVINAASLNNQQGLIHAKNSSEDNTSTTLNLDGELNNTAGQIIVNEQSLKITAGSLINDQLAIDGEVTQGTIEQQGAGSSDLDIRDELINHGIIQSQGQLNVAANSLVNSQTLVLQQLQLLESLTNSGDISVHELSLDLTGQLNNKNGLLVQRSNAVQTLKATQINNENGRIETSALQLTLQANNINNQNGELVSLGDDNKTIIDTNSLNNTTGIIYSEGDITTSGNSLTNVSGLIQGNEIDLSNSNINNAQGQIFAKNNLQVIANSELNNTQGTLSSESSITINSGLLDNSEGVIQALGQESGLKTTITTSGQLSNDDGLIQVSNDELSVNAQSLNNVKNSVENSGIQHSGNGPLTLDISQHLENRGVIASNGNIAIAANSLTNTNTLVLDSLKIIDRLTNSGHLESNAINATLSGDITNSGVLLHSGSEELTLSAANINNSGNIYSLANALNIIANSLDNTGQIAVTNSAELAITAQRLNNNNGAVFGGKSLTITNAAIENTDGGTINSAGTLIVNAASINNINGSITSASDAQLSVSGHLVNQQGILSTDGDLSLTASAINNNSGTIESLNQADNAVTAITTTGHLNNNDGTIQTTAKNLTLDAQSIGNQTSQSNIVHAGNGLLAINVTQKLDNSGTIVSNGLIDLTASELNNTTALNLNNLNLTQSLINSGSITAKDLNLTLSKTLDNSQGFISQTSGNTQTISASHIINNGAALPTMCISGQGQLVQSQSCIEQYNQGTIEFASNAVSIDADNIDNQQGKIIVNSASGDLAIDAQILNNNNGSIIANDNLSLGKQRQMTTLTNDNGYFGANDISANVVTLNNQDGEISASQNININATNLNNSNANIIATQQLSITNQQKINNTSGVLSANAFNITSQNVENNSGIIQSIGNSSGSESRLNVSHLLSSVSGLIATNNQNLTISASDFIANNVIHNGDGRLSVTASGELSLNESISSNGNADISANELTNKVNAKILAANLELTTATLTNSGDIQANDMAITATNQLTNTGKINQLSANNMTVNAGILTNSGEFLSNAQQLNLSAGTINNTNSLSHYGSTLNVDANSVINSGVIFTSGDLTQQTSNNTLQTIDNSAGVIGANKTIALTASGKLNNDNGQIIAGESISLNVNELSNRNLTNSNDNNKGIIDSRGMLGTSTISVNNTLNNTNGTIKLANSSASISAKRLDNGEISHTGSGELAIDVDGTLNNDNLIASQGSISLEAGTVNNASNGIIAAANLAVDAENVTNRGSIQANTLTISIADTLSNLDGFILQTSTSNQSINAAKIINSRSASNANNFLKGTIVSNATNLTLNAGTSIENSGDISHNNTGQLTLNTTSVSNSAKVASLGTLTQGATTLASLTNSGSVVANDIKLTTTSLNNNDGIIQASASLALTATKDINNQRGRISNLSTGADNTSISAGNTLNNNGGVIITKTTNLSLKANNISNQSHGIISHQGAGVLTLDASSINNNQTVFNNKKGITSSGSLDMKSAQLNNNYGFIAANDALTLSSTGDLNNQNGTIQANKLTLATTKSLNNQSGKIIQFGGANQNIMAKTLNNQGGNIASNALNLTLVADTIDNNFGVINHRGTGNLALMLDTLNNSNNGNINSQGAIVFNQAYDVNKVRAGVANINNERGTISAKKSLSLVVNNDINNAGGSIQGAGDLFLSSHTGSILNTTVNHGGEEYSGAIMAIHDFTNIATEGLQLASNAAATLNINADNRFDNTGGRVLSTAKTANVTAASIKNSGGQFNQYGDESLTLNGLLTNDASGRIQSESNLVINSHGPLNNNQGTITANGVVTLNLNATPPTRNGAQRASAFTTNQRAVNNTSGSIYSAQGISVNSSDISASGGSIQSNGSITLNLDTYVHQSVEALNAAGKLTIITNNLTLNDNLKTSGALDLQLGTSDFTNTKTIYSGGEFSINAKTLTNTNDGRIEGGDGSSAITLSGGLTNNGVIKSAGNLTTHSTTFNNTNGTFGANDNLTVNASSSIVNGDNSLLYAGNDLSLYSSAITNQNSTIFAVRDLVIANDASLNNASYLYNLSADIESGRDMILNAALIENKAFELEYIEESSASTRDFHIAARNSDEYGFHTIKHTSLRNFDLDESLNIYTYIVNADHFGTLYSEIKALGPTTFIHNETLANENGDIGIDIEARPHGVVISASSGNKIDLSKTKKSTITAGRNISIGSKEKIDSILNEVSSIHANNNLSIKTKTLDNKGKNAVLDSDVKAYFAHSYVLGQAGDSECLKSSDKQCLSIVAKLTSAPLIKLFTFSPDFISALTGGSTDDNNVYSSITAGGKLDIQADDGIRNGREASNQNSMVIDDESENAAPDAGRIVSKHNRQSTANNNANSTSITEESITSAATNREDGAETGIKQNYALSKGGNGQLDERDTTKHQLGEQLQNKLAVERNYQNNEINQIDGKIQSKDSSGQSQQSVDHQNNGVGELAMKGSDISADTSDSELTEQNVSASDVKDSTVDKKFTGTRYLPPPTEYRPDAETGLAENNVELKSADTPIINNELTLVEGQPVNSDINNQTDTNMLAGGSGLLSAANYFDNFPSYASLEYITAIVGLRDIIKAGSDFIALNPVNRPGFRLPDGQNGLFVLSNAEQPRYLVESNPEFTEYNNFISSDYLLERLGIEPDTQTIRLGDGFYEQRLLRDSIFAQTGMRYTDPRIGSEYDQFAFLMENAVQAAERMSLSIGVALTGEQVAALTHDIVWMETTIVNGIEVLAPVLYLAQLKETNIDSNGSIIAGRDVSINTDDLQNTDSIYAYNTLDVTTQDIVNRGLLAAANELTLDAGELVNLGTITSDNVATINADSILNKSLINADGSLDIEAFGDILNDGGDITGGDITLASTGGDVINQTRGGGLTTHQGNISGTGTVTLDAFNDVKNIGSTINGNNVVLNTTQGNVELITQSQTHTSNDGKNIDTSIGHTASINAVNNVTFNSGNDVNITAANVNAGGSISLNAQNDVNVGVIENQTRREVESKRNHTISDTITNVTSNLNAGRNLLASAGNDITLTGVQAAAGGDVGLAAAGNLTIESVKDSEYTYSQNVKKKSFGRKKVTTEESFKTSNVASTVVAGRDLLINAIKTDTGNVILTKESGDVNVVGSTIAASNNVIVASDGDVNFVASADVASHSKVVKKTGLFGLSKKEKGTQSYQERLNSAQSIGGGNTVVDTGGSLTLIGSNIDSAGSIGITAVDDVNVLAGTETTKKTEWEESTSFLSGNSLFELDEKKQTFTDNTAKASGITSGEHLSVQAGTFTALGSNLEGKSSVNITTDTGDIVIGAHQTDSSSASSTKSVSVSVADGLKALLRPDELIKSDNGQLKISIAKAEYDSYKDKATNTAQTGSSITSDGDVNLSSVAAIDVIGSVISSDNDSDGTGDINMSAGTNINIREANETSSFSSETTHGEAEVSVVVQHQAVELAKAALALKDAKEALSQAKKDKREFNKKLGGMKADLASLKQQYADGDSNISLAHINALSTQINNQELQQGFYEDAVVLSTANVAMQTVGLTQQTIASTSSTATWGFNVGTQFDVQASKDKFSSETSTKVASQLSGQDVNLNAGMDDSNHITVSGSSIDAVGKVSMSANEINIVASQNTARSKSSNESASLTLAVTAYGATSGGASYNNGQTLDSSVTHNASTINASSFEINTVKDTNVIGSQVNADSISGNIGGNLNVISTQDMVSHQSTNQGISASFSTGGKDTSTKTSIGDLSHAALNGGTGTNGSLGFNQSNTSGNSLSVVNQAGLFAGEGGLNLNVEGTTRLEGGVISASDKAENNQFTTGKLEHIDIVNTSDWSASASGVNLGFSENGSATEQVVGNILSNVGGDTAMGDAQTGVSQAIISDNISVTVKDNDNGALATISRDDSLVNTGAVEINTAAMTMAQSQASQRSALAGQIGAHAMSAVNVALENTETHVDEHTHLAIAAIVQGLSSELVGGDGTQVAKGIIAEQLAVVLTDKIGDIELASGMAVEEGDLVKVLAHGLVGCATSDATGGDCKSGAIGAATAEIISPLLTKYGLEEEDGQLAAIVAGALTSAITESDMGDAIVAAQRTEEFNRQAHVKETNWIKDNAANFAAHLKETTGEEISVEEATSRLAQQAAKQIDIGWRLTLDHEIDDAAASFLATTDATFTNHLGEEQKLFTVENNQFTRTGLDAHQVDKEFYQENLIPNVKYTPGEGVEAFRQEAIDSTKDVLNQKLSNVVKDIQENGVMDVLSNQVKSELELIGNVLSGAGDAFVAAAECSNSIICRAQTTLDIAKATKDGLESQGQALGESVAIVTHDASREQLNNLYGQDVSGLSETILGAQIAAVALEVVPVAKVGKAVKPVAKGDDLNGKPKGDGVNGDDDPVDVNGGNSNNGDLGSGIGADAPLTTKVDAPDAKSSTQSPEINPQTVAGKTPDQIDDFASQNGLISKGPDPKNGQGAYVDPATGQQRILCHTNCDNPHMHVNNPQGQRLDIEGNQVKPESPEAHLPVNVPVSKDKQLVPINTNSSGASIDVNKPKADVNVQSVKEKPDFYVGPDGATATLPSTGYRYDRLLNDDGTANKWGQQTLETKEGKATYIGTEKFDSGQEVRDAFQIKGPDKVDPLDPEDSSWSDGRLRSSFDTLQLFDSNGKPKVRVPDRLGDQQKGVPEPITEAYPEFGNGGAVQLHAGGQTIKYDKVEILPEKKAPVVNVKKVTNDKKVTNKKTADSKKSKEKEEE